MASNGRDRAARRFAASFAQPDLELAKWIAVITMAIDHYGKIVDESVFVETHAIGRLSFPLFAAIIAIRLAARPSLDQRYLRHLIPWTIVSQPIFVLVGRQWYDGNILVTLGLGVAATLVLQRRAELSTVSLAAALAAIAASSIFTDYGPLGVAMIPTMTFLARGGVHPAAAVGPLGLAANVNHAPPFLIVPDLGALLASPVLLFSMRAKVRLPRLPTQFFYAFYPGHLLALHLFDLYGWSGMARL